MSGYSIFCLVVYLFAILGIGVWAGKRQKQNVEDYFLASRGLGVLVLLMTQAATIFSAFTFYGLPGSAYKSGIAMLGGLSVGSVAMSFLFYIIGYRTWLVGQKYRFLTPPEVVRDRFGSKRLSDVFGAVSIIFVLPYLVMQPIGAGHALSAISNGAIPYLVGSSGITILILFYVFYAGFRGISLTDTFQGLIMLSFAWIVMLIIGGSGDGWSSMMNTLREQGALNRGTGYWTWKVSFSWAFLIAINSAMQPQTFTRFLTARSVDVFRKHFAFYPLLVFSTLPVIFVGLFARVLVPGLEQADQALVTALAKFAPPIMSGIMVAVGLAAMMSTADSQLLIVGAMFTNDFYKPYIEREADPRRQFWVARIVIVAFAVLAWALAFKPPGVLLKIGAMAFTGIAVLTPTGLAMYYWKRATAAGALTSIILGEIYVIGFYTKLIPASWNMGFLVVVPAILLATIALIVVSLLTSPPEQERIDKYFNLFDRVFG